MPIAEDCMSYKLMRGGLQIEYPSEWPSFFHDLLGMLSKGPPLVDMFCRIMTAVDEDVISLEINRSVRLAHHAALLKNNLHEENLLLVLILPEVSEQAI